MMTQAFYTGLSGLRNSSTGIDVVSNNMSNTNTVGYRSSGVEFSSLFENMVSQTADTSSINSSIGIGVSVQATPMSMANGELLLSERNTDIAIDGDGWFGVQSNGTPQYTRAGSFTFNANSELVTYSGEHVLGTMAGNIEDDVLTAVKDSTALSDVNQQESLRFSNQLTFPAQASTNVNFYGNIGLGGELPSIISAAVIDDQGVKNQIKLTFTKSDAENQNQIDTKWDVVAVAQTLDGETIFDTQTGTIEFDTKGALIAGTLPSINNNGTEVSMNLGSEYNGVLSNESLEIGGSSSSDGIQGGELEGYSINANAEVIATFSNGRQSSVGKIALYHFQNDQGLERISGSRFGQTSNSGEASFFQDANGNNILGAQVSSYRLEGSNANVATSLTELIILQRSFDANSKSITTADQMLQKALNMGA